MDEENKIYNLLNEKILFGESLIQRLTKVEHVEGVQKLQRKINNEIKFLKKIRCDSSAKEQHLQCSNLSHLSALVNCILQESNVTHVDYAVLCGEKKIRIDVISDNGSTWIKVIARNPKSLSDAAFGRSNYGSKNVIDQAKEYIEAAKLHPHLFNTPKVIFKFAGGIDCILAEKLKYHGLSVITQDGLESEQSTSDTALNLYQMPIPKNINTLNLDVTSMLAYVSALCNGSCNYEFVEPLLTEQAKWERKRPIKILLDNLFQDKQLVCCVTAKEAFDSIVNLIGGPMEKKRAQLLFQRIAILPDNDGVDALRRPCDSLLLGGRIKNRSKKIFSFGQSISAITLTANEGFVRSAKQQGVELAVFVHEARALTELKEEKAKLIEL